MTAVASSSSASRYRQVLLFVVLLASAALLLIPLQLASPPVISSDSTHRLHHHLGRHSNTPQLDAQLSLLSFNIDGLNDFARRQRTEATLSILLASAPDVIQLQEVIHDTYALLQPALSAHGYRCSSAPSGLETASYFTLSAVKASRFDDIRFVTEDFPSNGASSQGRNLLLTYARWLASPSPSDEWLFINTHLESTGAPFESPQSQTRIEQLQYSLSRMMSHAATQRGPFVLLSGDLNLRDEEAQFVLARAAALSSTVPPSPASAFSSGYDVRDVALMVASTAAPTFYRPYQPTDRRRYDRVYFLDVPPPAHHSGLNPRRLVPVSLDIVGNDTVPALATFEGTASYVTPSDHRGLVAVFSVV